MTAHRRGPANEAGVCCSPPGGLSAVAEVSVLHRLLGQEASARRAICQGCRHCFALCAAAGSVSGALFVVARGSHPSSWTRFMAVCWRLLTFV